LNEGLAKQLLLRLAEEHKAGSLAPPRRLPGEHTESKALAELTAREVETLRLLVKGRTNRDIARNLAISLSTAKQHVRHVIAKLGVSDRTQAAVKAIELGLPVEHERQ
jgi:DNA-binding NarL/FixJ family response regulator